VELRAVTGPDYGRIYDHELVEAVQRIAGNGTGDTRWKVPGVLDWSTGIYNPRVDITKDTTTLYASDRDVFLFLVDDLNPIEAGRLPDGSPDLYLPGLLLLELRGWRQDAGHGELLSCARSARIETSGASRISRRSASATANMPPTVSPMRPRQRCELRQFLAPCPSSTASRRRGSGSWRAPKKTAPTSCADAASPRRDRQDHRHGAGEEGRPPESIFDFVQGITAVARDKPHQDARLDMEGKAKKLLDRAA
jgi:hypothetical protein